MKKFWLILLSLGLVMAFSVSALAIDIKVSGEYYAAGLYLDKTALNSSRSVQPNKKEDQNYDLSTAFFFQRLRVGTDFIVSPCLKLVTRFDALERIWGGARSSSDTTADIDSAGTRAENENIAVDWAYINYVTPIGAFDVGYMNYGATGTIFGNSSYPAGRIKYKYSKSPFTIGFDYSKLGDKSYSAINSSATWTDADKDVYGIEGTYQWKNVTAGMKINYYRYADKKPSDDYIKNYFLFTPYATAKVGPVNIQAEFNYATGDDANYDNVAAGDDVKLEQMSGWVDALANFGMFYAGGTVAYVSGDDPGTLDKKEGGTLSGGVDWNPCLILFNNDITYWVGEVSGHNYSVVNGTMKNAWFFQGRVGVKPTPQWDVMLSVSHAFVDRKPVMPEKGKQPYLNGTYGTEIDLVSTYKITNNLSYMIGIGYLFTGDYYKGAEHPPGQAPFEVQNDLIAINKLTLSF